jgi:GT2 family glycosyltransferase
MYTEDVEYCLRAKNNNLKVACNTNTHIFHSSMGAIDTRRSAGIRKYYQTRNNILMAIKYFERPHMLIYIIFMLIRVIKNSLLFLWRGNFFAIHMCFYGFYDGIRLRDGKLDKRKGFL